VLPERPVRILAIGSGGSLGTLARYGLERALAPPALGFPWPTMLANVTGSLLLGVIVTLVVERWPPTRFVRPFAAIGFCGGFTTFSTLVVESSQLGRHGRVGLAFVYLGATLGAGLAAAALGIGLARRGLPTGARQPIPDPDDLGTLADRLDRLAGPGSGRGPS
jgi:CrcB protein